MSKGDVDKSNVEKKKQTPAELAAERNPNRPSEIIEIDDSEHSLQVEFEEDDFDHEFDDDFEEEIKGEYDLEDDHYGEEFKKEFGHLTPDEEEFILLRQESGGQTLF